MRRANGVKHLRYEAGGENTPEMEYWLIEHERTHKPVRRGDHDSFMSPEQFAKTTDTETVLTLAIGTLRPTPPRLPRGFMDILSESTKDSGEYGLLPGLGFGLAPPNEDGLVSLPPRADISIDLSSMNFGRSKPTELGGELPSYGGLPRLRRNIGVGLTAFFQKQEEDFEASIDRVRAKVPDHCIDNSVVFILQDVTLDIGKFLPNMGETRMLAAHYQFNLGAGRIKKFKAKKRKEKRRELKV